MGQCGPCVVLGRRRIRGGLGRILWHSMSCNVGVWVKSSLLEMCVCNTWRGRIAWDCNVLVWHFNGKLLKNLNVLCANLCIKKWKKLIGFKLHNVLLHFIKYFCVSSTLNGKNVCEVLVFGVGNCLLSQEDNNWYMVIWKEIIWRLMFAWHMGSL
jgi:hypothetical protein